VYLYCVYCFVLCVLHFGIVSFMYTYSYLFCLYWCKDYCHRVTTQLQLVVVVAIVIEQVKQSRYRPGQAQRVPRSSCSQIT